MNIRDLRYVVALVEERHFGRAAQRCNVTQPALSGQIRKLEDYLGVVLFERTNRNVQVTALGARIGAQARQVITLADEIVATAQAARDPLSGAFSLGMIATVGPYLAPLILAAIYRELPEISLTLTEGLTSDLEARVAAGDIDAAILATAPVDPRLRDVLLYDEPFWVALPKNHPLADQDAVDVGDLAHAELLLLADGHCLRDQVVAACRASTGSTRANTRETSLETLLALVAAGDGVTLVPALTRVRGGAERRGVVIRREAGGTAGRGIRLVCRSTFPRSELVTRLSGIIRESVPETEVRRLTQTG